MQTFKVQFKTVFNKLFSFEATEDQKKCVNNFVDFLDDEKKSKVFVLTGYAGTGKTTLIANFVQALKHFNRSSVLLAPTGRAAKVFSSYSKYRAFTIHKKIYRKVKIENGSIQLSLAFNSSKNTIYIVDEASMLGDYNLKENGTVSDRNLLEDLISYVFSGENNSLVLVGDEGQLPPIGSNFSPALNKEYLSYHFPKLNLYFGQLNLVLRQASNSGILVNATLIRNMSPDVLPKLKCNFKDVLKIQGLDLQEHLESSYNNSGLEETIIITKSNKRANLYNQEIRKRILFHEEVLSSGDMLMVVKNSYFWVDELSDIGFIANGEIAVVKKIIKFEELYGFSFAHVIIELIDFPDQGEIKLIVLLNTIASESPNLSREDQRTLFFEIEKDYLDERNKQKRYESILNNPYFNALQVKFAYAITCHKAQGGQWSEVYLDHGLIDNENIENTFNRWLYTAFTRAKEKLYLLNFNEELF
jgi:exodeoxyribonuclease V